MVVEIVMMDVRKLKRDARTVILVQRKFCVIKIKKIAVPGPKHVMIIMKMDANTIMLGKIKMGVINAVLVVLKIKMFVDSVMLMVVKVKKGVKTAIPIIGINPGWIISGK